MSSTESRTGFRLPWSSDRSHESQPADLPVEPAASDDVVWPDGAIDDRIGVTTTQPRPFDALEADPPADAAGQSPDSPTQEPAMLDAASIPPAPVAPRKPSKLMVDLSAAIRATADAARAEALTKVDADVAAVVADIRASSKDGEASLKQASDEDVVAIREWCKAEIARIKEETEARIEARKTLLGEQIAAHAAEIERRVGGVEATAASYRDEMAAYADRLAGEDDPSRLATMAETMPEPPELVSAGPSTDDAAPWPAEAVATAEPITETEALGETQPVAAEPVVEPVAAVVEAEAVAGAAWADQPAADQAAVAFDGEAVVPNEMPAVEADVEAQASSAQVDALAAPWVEPAASPADSAWGGATHWGNVDSFQGSPAAGDDVQRWGAGDAPEGFPEPAEGGDPVDRGAIMAALEAAAEAVVAAEAAAESADQAEAAADVAETAAELVVGRTGSGDELDPEAQAAFSARVDAGGFDTESFADRLASLLPGNEPVDDDGSVRTTRVIVTGLVSVASIASFKRHLGRIAGVDGVAVASGPEGEFVFNVTHAADVSFRDAVPTLPGFAARVTSIGDGVITVTARDPEAEG